LTYLPTYTQPDLANNKIKEITGLQGLTKLRKLDLGANRIRSIPLEEFSGLFAETLEELWLGKNKIECIGEGLGKLTKLRCLDVQSNRLTNIEGLEAQQQTLEELYLADNAIDNDGAAYFLSSSSSASTLLSFPELSTIDMSKNRLTSTKCFGPLLGLEELWLSSNQIASFEDISSISMSVTAEGEVSESSSAPSRKLEGIYLEFNPIAEEFEYRKKLKQIIPTLDTIDGVMIRGGPPSRPGGGCGGGGGGGCAPPIMLSVEDQLRAYQDKIIARAREEQQQNQQQQQQQAKEEVQQPKKKEEQDNTNE
jgi:protein phosphatase 1 regulatory subunit 7